jgi:hypothetical protein
MGGRGAGLTTALCWLPLSVFKERNKILRGILMVYSISILPYCMQTLSCVCKSSHVPVVTGPDVTALRAP